MLFIAIPVIFGCRTIPNPEPILQCKGHFEFFVDFPPNRGEGSQFIFHHSIADNGNGTYSAVLHETWIDGSGFPEEQFTCVATPVEKEKEATLIANTQHRIYEESQESNKAENALNCKGRI